MYRPTSILIYGSGAYSQALSFFLLKSGYRIIVYSPIQIEQINNNQWLSQSTFKELKLKPRQFQILSDLKLISKIDFLILAITANQIPAAITTLQNQIKSDPIWIIISKGLLAPKTNHNNCWVRLIEQTLPSSICSGVASVYGPSVAQHVLNHCVTTFLVAGSNFQVRTKVTALFNHHGCLVSETDDVYGAELSFALKNVFGIAGGIWKTLSNITDSERCALIGLAYQELGQLLERFGCESKLLLRAPVIGDFMLALTSDGSRNFKFGISLVSGHPPPPTTILEGRTSLKIIYQRIKKLFLPAHFPITSQLYRVVFMHESVQKMRLKNIFNLN